MKLDAPTRDRRGPCRAAARIEQKQNAGISSKISRIFAALNPGNAHGDGCFQPFLSASTSVLSVIVSISCVALDLSRLMMSEPRSIDPLFGGDDV